MFIRLSSLALGLMVLVAPIFLALFVAGVLEPSRPASWTYLSTFIFVGLGLSLGYFCVAFFGYCMATFSSAIRYFFSFLLALPLLFSLYLGVSTDVPMFAAICVLVSIYSAWLCTSCLWPSFNLSFKRDA